MSILEALLQLGLDNLEIHVLSELQKALESEDRGITLAIHRQIKIIAVWSGVKQNIYGAAIDLGSTTLAAHLCHLGSGEVVSSSSIMNPQIRFGEDLMSRVSYVMMHEEVVQQLGLFDKLSRNCSRN